MTRSIPTSTGWVSSCWTTGRRHPGRARVAGLPTKMAGVFLRHLTSHQVAALVELKSEEVLK